jgi:hypothetical protein
MILKTMGNSSLWDRFFLKIHANYIVDCWGGKMNCEWLRGLRRKLGVGMYCGFHFPFFSALGFQTHLNYMNSYKGSSQACLSHRLQAN